MDSILNLILRLRKQGNGGKETEAELKGVAGAAKGLTGAAQLLAGSAALGAVAGALNFCLEEARAARQALLQTEAVIKATGGAAGLSSGQVVEMAGDLERLTLASAETIQEGQNMLLTFKEIKGDTFERATAAMLDMGVAMNKGSLEGLNLQSTSIQLGKALNDPVKGVTALTKVGVTFTKEQKAMIKAMAEAGDVAGAQAIILAELESEFGGAAEAAGKAAGPFKRWEVIIGNIAETVGGKLLPALETAAQGLLDLTKIGVIANLQFLKMQGLLSEDEFQARAAALANDDLAGAMFGVDEAATTAAPAVDGYVAAHQSMVTTVDEATTATDDLTDSTEDLTEAQRDGIDPLKEADKVYREALNTLRDFNIGEAQRIELERELKLLSGEITAEDVEREKALGFLTKQLELGNISQAEYVRLVGELATKSKTATQVINETSEAIRNLPNRDVTITYRYNTVGRPPNAADGDIGLGEAPVVIAPGEDTQIGDQRASGGPVMVGESGAELFWPASGGSVMNNSDTRRLIAALEKIAGMGGGQFNMTINAAAPVTATEVAGLARALAGAM